MAVSMVSTKADAPTSAGAVWVDETFNDWREKSCRTFSRKDRGVDTGKTNRLEGLRRTVADDHKAKTLSMSALGSPISYWCLGVEN